MPLEKVKSVIGKVILTQDQNAESFILEETQKLNAFKANRGTHEVDFTTADGIKFALEAVGEKKLVSNVKDMLAIAEAEEYMCKFLMDKAGDDLDSFLNDFWLYLAESAKSMEDFEAEVLARISGCLYERNQKEVEKQDALFWHEAGGMFAWEFSVETRERIATILLPLC